MVVLFQFFNFTFYVLFSFGELRIESGGVRVRVWESHRVLWGTGPGRSEETEQSGREIRSPCDQTVQERVWSGGVDWTKDGTVKRKRTKSRRVGEYESFRRECRVIRVLLLGTGDKTLTWKLADREPSGSLDLSRPSYKWCCRNLGPYTGKQFTYLLTL